MTKDSVLKLLESSRLISFLHGETHSKAEKGTSTCPKTCQGRIGKTFWNATIWRIFGPRRFKGY
jgi:hypothetical protein